MEYYLAYRTILKNHNKMYFDTLKEMSAYLGEEITEEDCNKGYSIEKNGNFWLICKEIDITN